MAPFLILTALLVGMPANTMPTAIGLAFGADSTNAMMTGFGLHTLTSVLIGVIFGVVIANVNKLRIFGFTKGVSEGLITGMIGVRCCIGGCYNSFDNQSKKKEVRAAY